MRKPIIGISGVLEEISGRFCLHRAYANLIWQCGGIPIVLPFSCDPCASAKELCSAVDGILFSGGGDVHPKYYGSEIENAATFCPEAERDVFEFALFEEAVQKKLPMLGVCRGIQLMAVALGGHLLQQVTGHSGGVCHRAIWESEHAKTPTLLNSYHGQAVADVCEGAQVFVRAQDGLCEGFRLKNYPFCVGVQWHPERQRSEYDIALFSSFIAASTAFAAERDAALLAER